MNEFEKSELVGRIKARQLFPNYGFTESEDAYESWDLSGCTTSIADGDKNYFIEIKDREIPSTNHTTSYLEYDKLQRLVHVADSNGNATIIYLCFYPDRVAYAFNLRKVNITQMRLTTDTVKHYTKGNNEKISEKLFVELPYKYGRRYTY